MINRKKMLKFCAKTNTTLTPQKEWILYADETDLSDDTKSVYICVDKKGLCVIECVEPKMPDNVELAALNVKYAWKIWPEIENKIIKIGGAE